MELLSFEEEESRRSRWLWALAALLFLLLLLGLIWVWWSGSKSPSHPLLTKAAASPSEVAVAQPAPPPPAPPPAMSYDVQFGYHQSAIKTNEALTGAYDAWRNTNSRQCGNACTCETSARIDVVGHADRRTGTRRFNACISWKRANVVAEALAGLGVPRCDVTTAFMGDSETPSPEPDEATAAKHRNASMTIVAGNPQAKFSCVGACRSTL